MENIAEIIFAALSGMLQILGELAIQILWELICDIIGHRIRDVFRKPELLNPWFAAIGYGALGAAGGALSLLIFPELFIEAHLRGANLIFTPLAAGFVMAGIGAWRRRQGRDAIRLETFANGFLFALSMAAVRGWCGQ